MWMVSYGTESESECESSRIRIEVNFDRFHRFSRNLAVIRLQVLQYYIYCNRQKSELILISIVSDK